MCDKLPPAEQKFNQALKQLKGNIDFIKSKRSTSPRFVQMQEDIYANLVNYKQVTDYIMSTLELEVQQVLSNNTKEYKQLECYKRMLELICFIHGISDVGNLMKKGENFLIETLRFHQKTNSIQLPIGITNLIDFFNDDEKAQFYKLLKVANIRKKNYEKKQTN